MSQRGYASPPVSMSRLSAEISAWSLDRVFIVPLHSNCLSIPERSNNLLISFRWSPGFARAPTRSSPSVHGVLSGTPRSLYQARRKRVPIYCRPDKMTALTCCTRSVLGEISRPSEYLPGCSDCCKAWLAVAAALRTTNVLDQADGSATF